MNNLNVVFVFLLGVLVTMTVVLTVRALEQRRELAELRRRRQPTILAYRIRRDLETLADLLPPGRQMVMADDMTGFSEELIDALGELEPDQREDQP